MSVLFANTPVARREHLSRKMKEKVMRIARAVLVFTTHVWYVDVRLCWGQIETHPLSWTAVAIKTLLYIRPIISQRYFIVRWLDLLKVICKIVYLQQDSWHKMNASSSVNILKNLDRPTTVVSVVRSLRQRNPKYLTINLFYMCFTFISLFWTGWLFAEFSSLSIKVTIVAINWHSDALISSTKAA